ncbi:MAG: ATP-binding protein [Proteobacteria bacterium]|nr:ATP-binding protein [Pseudomonadota bacterium]
MVRVLVAASLQLSSVYASTAMEPDEVSSGSCCFGFFERLVTCCSSTKKSKITPTTRNSPDSRASIAFVGNAPVVLRAAPPVTSMYNALVTNDQQKVLQKKAEKYKEQVSLTVNGALSDLQKLIKSGDFKTGLKLVPDIAGLLRQNFSDDASEEIHGYIHDINHFLNDLQEKFEFLAVTPASISASESSFSIICELISKIHQSKSSPLASPKPKNAYEVAKTAISLCSFSAVRGNTELSLSALPCLERFKFSNPEHSFAMVRILYNLLKNAIHYSSDVHKPDVRLQVNAYEDVATWVCRFSVIDNGVGMSIETQSKLFGFRYRAKETSHKPGSGIGLSSCKSLIEAMSGTISVLSEIGRGTTFLVNVPVVLNEDYVAKNLPIKKEKAPKRKIEKTKLRIAIADDQESILKTLFRHCVFYGLVNFDEKEEPTNVHCFTSGDLAFDAHKAEPYDILFLDETTDNGKKGSEIVADILKLGGVPPIMVSISGACNGDEFMAAGMDDCLLKPISRENFFKILDSYFEFPSIGAEEVLRASSPTPLRMKKSISRSPVIYRNISHV